LRPKHVHLIAAPGSEDGLRRRGECIGRLAGDGGLVAELELLTGRVL